MTDNEKNAQYGKILLDLNVARSISSTTMCRGEIVQFTNEEINELQAIATNVKDEMLRFAEAMYKAKKKISLYPREIDKLAAIIADGRL